MNSNKSKPRLPTHAPRRDRQALLPNFSVSGPTAGGALVLSPTTQRNRGTSTTLRDDRAIEAVPYAGPDPVGLTKYLLSCSPISLESFELKKLGEAEDFARQALTLWQKSLIHWKEPGQIKLYQRHFAQLFGDAASAKAQLVLCHWMKVCRGMVAPANGKKKQRSRGTSINSIFRAQTEEEQRQRDISFAKDHITLVYFERFGCLSCHEEALQQGRPHHACGHCTLCYPLIYQRRRSIEEGRRVQIHKPPARFGVPSLLAKRKRGL